MKIPSGYSGFACPLPTGRCWIRLGSNPGGTAGGVPDYASSQTVCLVAGGLSELGTTCRSLDMQHMSTKFRHKSAISSNCLINHGRVTV